MQQDLAGSMTEIGDQQRKLLHLSDKSQSFESGLGTLENMQQHILGNVDEGMTRLSNDMVTLGKKDQGDGELTHAGRHNVQELAHEDEQS